jgi:hypothetical protein
MTRSSHAWAAHPGKFDVLNLREQFDSSSPWGIPDLKATQLVPANLAAWNVARQRAHAADTGGACHFFLDDYRFETTWFSPEDTLERVQKVGRALTPDFSLWWHMPRAAQLWNVYRSRWVGAYWQARGVDVIPTVSWAQPDTYEFCFDGLPSGGSVALSAVGVKDREREGFEMGLSTMMARVQPARLIVYGKLEVPWVDIPVHEYPTFWDRRRKEW